MSKEKFKKLKEKEIYDIEEIILFNIDDFKYYKDYENKSIALGSVKEWIELREKINSLDYTMESYYFLKFYYEERGFSIEDLNEAFYELLREEKIVNIFIFLNKF